MLKKEDNKVLLKWNAPPEKKVLHSYSIVFNLINNDNVAFCARQTTPNYRFKYKIVHIIYTLCMYQAIKFRWYRTQSQNHFVKLTVRLTFARSEHIYNSP